MPIPKNINKEHVINAIQKIEREGVPERRESTRFSLFYEGKFYPPKYVISIANIFANGEEYAPSLFSGGDETNNFISKLGFNIVESEKSENKIENMSDYTIVPKLEPTNRSREFKKYSNEYKDSIVYEYLFNSISPRDLDEHYLGIVSEMRTGHESMNILHYIGLRDKHKGIFKDFSIKQAINNLKQQDSDFGLVIQSLIRYQQHNFDLDTVVEATADDSIKLEQLAATETEQIKITETEKEQVIKSRVGQSDFKKALLAIEKKCKLCGVLDERFLVASHIKPWSQSNNQERLDVNNGLLLCPNHDSLFDKGYISFDDRGTILISDSLDEATKVFLNINKAMNVSMNGYQQDYMKWHKDNIFKDTFINKAT
ncbi:HNH endonuclease [Cytobacillus firmus]|uniref:HNH endonuclease n=1 Tax=Cytobacillus firmus TaxID=1399 RepID=A0AA46P8X0_CYTFI|nr:HNH endonuclease [Cytobacillus firmus]UYG95341.1 HNH endonuclease [Cytobacillus firmus]